MQRWPERVDTERLELRTWREDDAEALAVAISSCLDHLLPWMPWAAFEPLAIEERLKLIREWDEQWQQGNGVVYGVFLDGAIVGGSGFHQRIGPGAIEIGYWVHADHTRRGFASEATAALTDVAFTREDIERVEIHHDRANAPSAGVPRALGYELVRETPDAVDAPGEEGVDCTWIVTRERWQARA